MIESILIPILTLPVPPLPSETFKTLSKCIQKASVSNTFNDSKLSHNGLVWLDMDPGLLHSDINIHSNILGVIGILYCSSMDDLEAGRERFYSSLNNYPKCLASIILVYDIHDCIKNIEEKNDSQTEILVIPSNYEFLYVNQLTRLVSRIIENLGKMVILE